MSSKIYGTLRNNYLDPALFEKTGHIYLDPDLFKRYLIIKSISLSRRLNNPEIKELNSINGWCKPALKLINSTNRSEQDLMDYNKYMENRKSNIKELNKRCVIDEDCTDGEKGECIDDECYYDAQGGGNKKSRKMKSNKYKRKKKTRKKTRRKKKTKYKTRKSERFH